MFSWISDIENLLQLAAALIFLAAIVLLMGRKKRPVVVKEVTLSRLSELWTKDGEKKSVHIAKLSPLWRDEKLIAKSGSPLPELETPNAQTFQEKYLDQGTWFRKAPLQRIVCGRMLQILDREGLCPSVVNVSKDVEGNWDENTYQTLAKTTLLDHSLNVAEHIITLLSKDKAWHVIPDALVAALGHDLGKLESVRGYLYSLGEHPLAAGRPLAGIKEFAKLPKKAEIERAIKLHHKIPDGLLGKSLKKADQLARQQELEETVSRQEEERQIVRSEDSPSSVVETEPDKVAAPIISAPRYTTDNAKAAWQAQADIYDENSVAEKDKGAKDVPKLMDISSWFDAERFLNELKPYINKMYGRRFLAFSMADGHVYFQAKVLEEVARRMAEKAGCMEIATMAHKDPTMRQVLLTVVQKFRAEPDIIARGLIKDNFFGGYFEVTRKIGKPIRGYYTPFHAEVFGSIAEMEQGKSDTLRNIQKVSPYLSRESEE